MPVLSGHDPQAVEAAAQCLLAGGLVGLPTETVYGLAARADDDRAVAGIFRAKGRPSDHPLIVHVADADAAQAFTPNLNPVAWALMDRFWPGPVTVIVPRRAGVASASAAGQDSIGLRCPAHPVALALLRRLRELGVSGLSAPSANRFGRVSPTSAAHVVQEFGPELLVLDGGDCAVGIESAIVDCTRGMPVLLRPGALTQDDLAAVAGQPVRPPDAQAPRASGTLASHYAPACRLRLLDRGTLLARLADWLAQPAETRVPRAVALYSREVLSPEVLWRRWPDEPSEAARDLFRGLRELDAEIVRRARGGLAEIWVEEPPEGGEWAGVRDRLARAATPADTMMESA